jgi:UDP-N-acetylglucosamine 2-epimerase (non-hydrolysing)
MLSPFPEEMNRSVISLIAGVNYAPTPMAKDNLLKEGVKEEDIVVSGNTVIDALYFTLNKVKGDERYRTTYDSNGKKIILITGHRRENFGDGFENICVAIKTLALKYPHFEFVYPVHLNPNVQEPVLRVLNGVTNVKLISPVDYIQFTQLMEASYLILTDSGGIQEEAPSIGKPVLVMRDTTERPEAVMAGAAKLVGTCKDAIIENVSLLIDDETAYNKMSKVANPFGDGTASKKIVAHLING